MTDAGQRAEWKRLEEAASPGPWHWGTGDSVALCEDGILDADNESVLIYNGRGSGDMSEEDYAFTISARTAVPALLRLVERLEKRIAELEGFINKDTDAV